MNTPERNMRSLPAMMDNLEYRTKAEAIADYADRLLADIKRDDTLALQQVRLITSKVHNHLEALREEYGVYQEAGGPYGRKDASDLVDFAVLEEILP